MVHDVVPLRDLNYSDREILINCSPLPLASSLYGALHILAWNYHFSSGSFSRTWRISAAIATSYAPGSLLLGWIWMMLAGCESNIKKTIVKKMLRFTKYCIGATFIALYLAESVARGFLTTASFVVLLDSPPSVYEVPGWTAYLPHL